jgi:4-diphosphocytidyl-2-C-methyl-D-erythritol kinase
MMYEELAPAKINLALHVRAKRSDGYHDLETIFAFATDGDVLQIDKANRLSLTIDGPFAEGLSLDSTNLVLRAATALASIANITGCAALHLIKNLPVASGIGGGSADAAAALRLLNRFWGLNWPLEQLAPIAASLGADVPACLYGQTCFGSGKGDAMTSMANPLSAKSVLLVNPMISLSTATVFAGWKKIDRGALAADANMQALLLARNDLESPAIAAIPQIAEILNVLREHNPDGLNRMSGSGATCFAIFSRDDACDSAARAIASANPQYWVMQSHLR